MYPTEEVGWGWFYGFRRRYPEITSKYVTNMKHYRNSWSTWAMMFDMYTIIYGLFEQWGRAVKLDVPQWQDAYGNEVPKDEALGHRVKLELLQPYLILSMDEQGDTGNQSEDKATRAYKVMCETNGREPKAGAATDDTSWTSQGFPTLGGKCVIGVVIIKKGDALDFTEKWGFDFTAKWILGRVKELLF